MSQPDFDLILVYTSFRRHDVYLNIAKALGRRLRLGIVKIDVDNSKIERTENRFLGECLSAGAVLVEGPAACRALMIPRLGLASIEKLEGKVAAGLRYESLLIEVSGPFSGIPFLAELHRRFGPATILAQDLSRFCAFEPEAKEFMRTTPLELVEVGSPYRKHPAVEGFETDYLVAYPSHNSIAQRSDTYPLLDRLMLAIDGLPRGSRVMIKPHNVKDTGNYLSFRSRTLSRLGLPSWLLKLPLLVLRRFAYLSPGGRPLYARLPRRAADMVRHLQNEYIFARCENLLERFPGYGVEHYISGVRKGVLTGLSTVLCETLQQGKPVYCFDRLPLEGRLANFQVMARSYRIQEEDGFSSAASGAIPASSREADMMEYLLQHCCKEAAPS